MAHKVFANVIKGVEFNTKDGRFKKLNAYEAEVIESTSLVVGDKILLDGKSLVT